MEKNFKYDIRTLILVVLRSYIILKKIILLFLNGMLEHYYQWLYISKWLLEAQNSTFGKLNFTRNLIFKKNLFNKIILKNDLFSAKKKKPPKSGVKRTLQLVKKKKEINININRNSLVIGKSTCFPQCLNFLLKKKKLQTW